MWIAQHARVALHQCMRMRVSLVLMNQGGGVTPGTSTQKLTSHRQIFKS